jgi:hypothetical protein
MLFRVFYENPAYLYAFAFPAEARTLLILPLPLILVLPELLIAGFLVWRLPNTLRRGKVGILLSWIFALGYTGFLGWAGLLTAGL